MNSEPNRPGDEPFANPQLRDEAAEQAVLHASVCDRIAREFGGTFPEGVHVVVDDRRVELSGCVEDVATAQRIEKAASVAAGVLGVHNGLTTRQPPPPPEESAPASDGVELPDPPGQIDHKV